ncbi:MAG TPA: hypothetical protein VM425_11230 [Myxococcota bacterium]|nr:hypothetical protein [Myxococcota bacterium]
MCVFLLIAAVFLPACKKKSEITASPDAATTPADTGAPSLPDSGAVTEPATGVFDAENGQIARAEGRAPKGVDISLARQAAANRARANLAKILKDKGISVESPMTLRGATIERVYTRGRYVYAVAAVSLPEQDDGVNVPAPDPSNTHEKDSTGKTSTSPDGGQQ